MKVALIEFKVRIMPPADAFNEVMDEALALFDGPTCNRLRKVIELEVKARLGHRFVDGQMVRGLEGFTVEVEEIS